MHTHHRFHPARMSPLSAPASHGGWRRGFRDLALWLLLAAGAALTAHGQAPKLFVGWEAPGSYQSYNPDGSGSTSLTTFPHAIWATELDPVAGKIYYAGFNNRIASQPLGRMNLDGTGKETIVPGDGLYGIFGLALDRAGGKIYWADGYANIVKRANLDGTNIETLFGGNFPFGIQLDVPNGVMYVSLLSDGKVVRANLDGTGVTTIANITQCRGLALDRATQTLYVGAIGGVVGVGGIARVSTAGGAVTAVIANQGSVPAGVTLDPVGQTIYWTDESSNGIRKVKTDGTGFSLIVPATADNSYGIAFYSGDGQTTTPSLVAPANDTLTKSPVSVSFNLPEAALPGSVKLMFSGTGGGTLTLAASQESAGAHAFTFDPANPTTAAQIASGGPILDGTYSVVLSYQDALGNPQASSVAAANVRIDTTAPEIATPGHFEVLTESATGATVDFDVSAADNLDPAPSLVVAPPSGSPFPLGDTTVEVTATDAVGNEATANFTVTVTLAEIAYDSVYAKGGAVPTAGSDPRIGTGALFTTLYVPAVNASGTVAFRAGWKAGKVSGSGIFVGNVLLVAVNDPVPGLSGVKFKALKDPVIDDRGNVAFIATLSGSGVTTASDTVVAGTGRDGSLEILAREGSLAPGAGPATFKAFQNVAISGHGTVVATRPALNGAVVSAAQSGTLFTATLAGATTATDSGAWWLPAGGSSVQLLVREGNPLPDGLGNVKTFQVLKSVAGSPGQSRGLIDGNAVLLQAGSSTTGVQVQLLATPSGLSAVAASGDVLGGTAFPEAKWLKMSLPSASTGGQFISVAGELTKKVGGLGTTDTKGIFQSADQGATWDPVARVTDDAPGLGASEKFSIFKDPVNSPEDGSVAFIGTVKGGSVTTATDTGIWWQADGGSVELVAREGSEPPEAAGAKWKTFDSLTLPGGETGPLFLAHLLVNTGHVTTANDVALYGVNSLGNLHTLIREGAEILGKTVKTFNVLKAVPGSNGSGRAFNTAGEVIVLVTWSDATTGIVRIKVP